MPPGPWKSSIATVMMIYLFVVIGHTDATEGMQQAISMTADGWKPIIGSSRAPPSYYQDEIKYYQNPILKETVKAEPLPTTTPGTTLATTIRQEPKTIQNIPLAVNIIHQGPAKGKIPPHTKQSSQYFILPNHGSHGPHIPLNSVAHGRPGQHGVLKKFPGKNHLGHSNGKMVLKKPVLGQLVTSHSNRNEVFVPAPAQGSYSFFSQGKNNVRTRESSGMGNAGQKLFSIKQPHGHMEFTNHFPSNLFQQISNPVQHVIYQNQHVNEIVPPYQVDTHQNLLPPPIFKNYAERNPIKHNYKGKINPDIRVPNDKVIFGHNPLGPNDLILQLPSYEQSLFGFGKNKFYSSPNIDVTREKLQTFHKDNPPNFNHQPTKEIDYHSFRKPVTNYPKSPTYEVTEGKWEDNSPLPSRPHRPINEVQPLELNLPAFLPTPYKPDGVIPTSPTQNEVSTIFGQLSNSVKHYPESYARDPYFFDVKEVSTHYPILGKPEIVSSTTQREEQTTSRFTPNSANFDIETTTDSTKQTTEKPVRINSYHRKRRPTSRITTTTQLSTEAETEKEETSTSGNISVEESTEKLHQHKRPIKTRPIVKNSEEDPPRIRDRHRKRPYLNDSRKNQYRKRVRPSRYEIEEDSTIKPNEAESKEEEVTELLPIIQRFTTHNYESIDKEPIDPTLPPDISKSVTQQDETSFERHTSIGSIEEESSEQRNPNVNNYSEIEDIRYRKRTEISHETSTPAYENETNREEDTISLNHESLKDNEEDGLINAAKNYERFKTQYVSSTSEEPSIATTLNLPEKVEEVLTIKTPELISLFESEDTPEITTTSEPTTTILATPTKSNRRRPIKYNASSRPRFSVKDYRQRLNQYSSTSSTSTETPKPSTDHVRLRFPTRLRRPNSATLTNTEAAEESTKSKFVPKEPRHSSPHPAVNELITEKNIKSVNTRLRPFGRTKTTTEHSPTASPKISIKPNLFSNRRRPTSISLKARIQNRNNNKTNDSEIKDTELTTIVVNQLETSSLIDTSHSSSTKTEKELTDFEDISHTTPPADILKNDAFMYSQRVSDLTSSMKNDYEGFKAVPSNSRRIPNYYTISTEDPILPIEAFFSNINDKGK